MIVKKQLFNAGCHQSSSQYLCFGGADDGQNQNYWMVQADWPTDPVAEKSRLFKKLCDDWVSKTAGLPRVVDKLRHEGYKRIIGWGQDAVPHILADLRDSEPPKHWFEALHRITGADPVPHEHRGDIKKMAEAWVQWGRDHQKIH